MVWGGDRPRRRDCASLWHITDDAQCPAGAYPAQSTVPPKPIAVALPHQGLAIDEDGRPTRTAPHAGRSGRAGLVSHSNSRTIISCASDRPCAQFAAIPTIIAVTSRKPGAGLPPVTGLEPCGIRNDAVNEPEPRSPGCWQRHVDRIPQSIERLLGLSPLPSACHKPANLT